MTILISIFFLIFSQFQDAQVGSSVKGVSTLSQLLTVTTTPTPILTIAPTDTVTPEPSPIETLQPTIADTVFTPTPVSTASSTPFNVPTSASMPCQKKSKGDANCNNVIDLTDFMIWKEAFVSSPQSSSADFDGNGVSLIDYLIWKSNYQP